MIALSLHSLITAFFMLALGPALLSSCGVDESTQGDSQTPVSVRVAPVVSQADAEPLRFAGTVRSRERATLTFQVNGALQWRPVKLGQAVAMGEVLARLYNPQLEPARDSAKAKLRELKAQASQTKRELDRAQALHKKGVQSVQGLEQARAAHEVLQASVATAQAALAEAERMVAETELRAPFAGKIESLNVELGEFVSAGQPVIGLSAADGMEVQIKVPEHLLADLTLGDEIPVWMVRHRSMGRITARVGEIAQSSGNAGELQTVVVNLIEPPVDAPLTRAEPTEDPSPWTALPVPAAGTPVEVGIPVPNHHSLSVPMLSVMKSPSGAAVFRVRGGTAQRVPVHVVQLLGENVLVQSSALKADDTVVFAGLTRLADGDVVEVLQ